VESETNLAEFRVRRSLTAAHTAARDLAERIAAVMDQLS